MKLKVILAAALMVAGAQAAHADDAGCGLGSLIITDNTKLMQVLAATTNGIGGQTFAISTGTSNCKAQNFVMNDKAIQYFTEVNHNDLSREMAQGQGEKLNTLAALYGCQGSAQKDFAKMTQGSYSQIVPSADTQATDLVRNLNGQFSSHPDLAKACGAAI
jgi:hypothetical protein